MNITVLSCLLAVCIFINEGQSHKVSVTVYYESLCSYSRTFFTSQLYPALKNPNLSKLVNLTMVPYGKSTQTSLDGSWQFQCHHGPYECYGNTIHACALHEIEKTSPTPKDEAVNQKTLAFINCLMTKTENITEPGQEPGYEFPIKNCSEISHVPTYTDIENCVNHQDGLKYLAQLGEMTANLKPPLGSVPAVVFDGQYKKEDCSLARRNFLKALCQYIKKDTMLDECKPTFSESPGEWILDKITFWD